MILRITTFIYFTKQTQRGLTFRYENRMAKCILALMHYKSIDQRVHDLEFTWGCMCTEFDMKCFQLRKAS